MEMEMKRTASIKATSIKMWENRVFNEVMDRTKRRLRLEVDMSEL
jgi:hypothetical protein